jgi:hypothetical protein
VRDALDDPFGAASATDRAVAAWGKSRRAGWVVAFIVTVMGPAMLALRPAAPEPDARIQ